jgi:hypothetical protein
MKDDDGGSAFPFSHEWENEAKGYTERFCSDGMSLRDWFAGQALPIAIMHWPSKGVQDNARRAYQYADAMLEARER